MHKNLSFSFIIASFFLLTSCQDILECIINRKPILSEIDNNTGRQGEYFFGNITSQIKNEPRDNDYFYYFNFYGDLPEGVDVFFDFRDVIVEGYPRTTGRYRFTITLDVEQVDNYCENQLNDCDGLCEESTSRTYIITIR